MNPSANGAIANSQARQAEFERPIFSRLMTSLGLAAVVLAAIFLICHHL